MYFSRKNMGVDLNDVISNINEMNLFVNETV